MEATNMVPLWVAFHKFRSNHMLQISKQRKK